MKVFLNISSLGPFVKVRPTGPFGNRLRAIWKNYVLATSHSNSSIHILRLYFVKYRNDGVLECRRRWPGTKYYRGKYHLFVRVKLHVSRRDIQMPRDGSHLAYLGWSEHLNNVMLRLSSIQPELITSKYIESPFRYFILVQSVFHTTRSPWQLIKWKQGIYQALSNCQGEEVNMC